jgi:hypothetical protein
MGLETFRQWIRQIYATRDEELDCDELFELVSKYVDMEIAGERTKPHFSEVEHHLSQCPRCYDLYLALRDAALLESQHTEPSSDQEVEMFELFEVSKVEPSGDQELELLELLEVPEAEPFRGQGVGPLKSQQATQQGDPESAVSQQS